VRKNSIVLGAVAGIASCALGQSASLSIVASQTVVDSTVTTSITLAVYGDADLGTHITGAWFGLSATGGEGVVDDMVLSSVAPWGELGEDDFGHAGDGNYNGVSMGQVVFPPFLPPDPASALGSGPVLLANLRVTIAEGSLGLIDWSLVGSSNYHVVLETFASHPAHEGNYWQFAYPDFGSTSVRVVPAPSGLALIGLGVLVVGRRRCV